MTSTGTANTQLQTDFAHRSAYLMSVVGKQVAKAFYAQGPGAGPTGTAAPPAAARA